MCHTCRVNRQRHQTRTGEPEHLINAQDGTQVNLLLLFLRLPLRRAFIVHIQLGPSVHLVLAEEEDVLRFAFHASQVRLHALALPPLEVRDRDPTVRLPSDG